MGVLSFAFAMRRVFRLFPVWVWILGLVLLIAFINALLEPPQTRKIVVPAENSEPKKSLTSAYQEFSQAVNQIDPQRLSVGDIEQFEGSELLYITAGPDFLVADKIVRGELAISLRDLWKKTCKCNPVLIFRTENKQRLLEITSLGQPEHIEP